MATANVPRGTAPNLEPIELEITVKLRVYARPEAEGGYSIAVPALAGCVSEAMTRGEVVPNITEAAELWLECQHDQGLPGIVECFTPDGEAR